MMSNKLKKNSNKKYVKQNNEENQFVINLEKNYKKITIILKMFLEKLQELMIIQILIKKEIKNGIKFH